MKITNLRQTDAERVHHAFLQAAVARGERKKSGFFEYPLTEEDIRRRLEDTRLSLSLEEQGRLLGYAIAYPLSRISDIDRRKDPVLQRLEGEDDVVYFDQLFINNSLPLYMVGRFVDSWTNLAFSQGVKGIVCAIPQKPWKNIASTRLVLSHGFNRQNSVSEGDIALGIFAKPLWATDKDFPKYYHLGN
jgi:hypothetical protein